MTMDLYRRAYIACVNGILWHELNGLTDAELKELAKQLGIRNKSKRREKLIEQCAHGMDREVNKGKCFMTP
jgi:hypothetical protein